MNSMPAARPGEPLRGDQRPRLCSVPPSAASEGPRVFELARAAGLHLDDWEQWVLDQGLGRDGEGKWSAFEVALIVSRQNGKGAILEALELAALFLDDFGVGLILHSAHEFKDLDVATPILTANRGFVTMGELRGNDEVFAPDGQRTKIVAVHPIRRTSDCYRVHLADGQSVVAGSGHLWPVTEVARSGETRERVVTTEEMRRAGLVHEWKREHSRDRHIYRWRLAIPQAADSDPADVPVHPYLLGIWLGDGASAAGRLTIGAGDLPYFLARLDELGERYTVSEDKRTGRVFCVGIPGLLARLRAIGVLGNKHIPDAYLGGSIEQRRALLEGILDTDGTASAHQVAVTMIKRPLMEGVLTLVRSLGYRATLREFRASLNGQDAGPMYRVQFAPAGSDPFGLDRKNAAIKRLKAGRSQYNAVVRIDPVLTRPTRCITVAHESGSYVAGRGFIPTHNTAAEAFRRVLARIDENPLFRRRVAHVYHQRGAESIELRNGKRLRFIARTGGSGRGFSADLVILDEAFELGDAAMAALLPTLSARPNPQIWYTSTAGMPTSVQLGRVRERGLAGGDPSLAFFEWSVDPASHDPASPADWARANPGLGIRITPAHVERERAALAPDEFARERLGVGLYPTDLASAWQVIPREAWESLTAAPVAHGRIALAVDVSPAERAGSVVAAWRRADGNTDVEVVDHQPGTSWMPERIAGLVRRHRPVATVIDGRSGTPAGSLVDELEARGVEITRPNVREVAQGCGAFLDMVTDSRTLRHPGDPGLDAAVAGAVRRDLGDGWAWDRKSAVVDISPLVAATLACWAHAKFAPRQAPYDLLASVR